VVQVVAVDEVLVAVVAEVQPDGVSGAVEGAVF
jgi:hypothetical protein